MSYSPLYHCGAMAYSVQKTHIIYRICFFSDARRTVNAKSALHNTLYRRIQDVPRERVFYRFDVTIHDTVRTCTAPSLVASKFKRFVRVQYYHVTILVPCRNGYTYNRTVSFGNPENTMYDNYHAMSVRRVILFRSRRHILYFGAIVVEAKTIVYKHMHTQTCQNTLAIYATHARELVIDRTFVRNAYRAASHYGVR